MATFVPQQRQQASTLSMTDRIPHFTSDPTMIESSWYTLSTSDLNKSTRSNADGGTYTCTYHGCTLRFETRPKLQKHKREAHRQIGGARARPVHGEGASAMTSAAPVRNSQAGPHKCERINPATGMPCNTNFSQPYNLTRHEDTIHHARKQQLRCDMCTDGKTLSRNDALARHMRVVHPDVDWKVETPRMSS
jgi:hypothetical protein